MSKKIFWRAALIAGTAVLSCYAAVLKHYSAQGWDRYVPASNVDGAAEASIKRGFLSTTASDDVRYRALFSYFLAGAFRFTDATGARVQYPGAASVSGYRISGLEGFARTGVLFAAWVASGRDPRGPDAVGVGPDLVGYLRRALLAGTDPRSAGYWGRIRDMDQRLVEAADVARILWLTRKQIWQRLDQAQRWQIAAWLRQVDGRKSPNTVLLLVPLIVDMVLNDLGAGAAGAELPSALNYPRFKENYLGNGWFSDPPNGADFYNTWGMSYELYWIALIDPQFDREFILTALRQSADLTAHLIGTDGLPLMGRSLCYRTAVPVPLLAEAALDHRAVSPGLARHALNRVWRHFVAHGALQDGALTQGYYGADLRIVNLYTGPGSCHWGLRSLVLAFMQPADSEFWHAAEQALPVENGDYRLAYDKLGWIVSGTRASGRVTIEIPANVGHAPLQPYAAWRHWLEAVFRRPFRPPNDSAQYGRASYSSDAPLGGD